MAYEDDQIAADRESFLSVATYSLGLPALFYGSLRDPTIFRIVVGRPLESVTAERVVLRGHALAKVIVGDGCPGVFKDARGSEVPCLLVHDLSDEEMRRIAWYEWDEYRLERFTVADGRTSQAFNPDLETIRRLHGMIDFHPWSFEEWRETHHSEAIDCAHEWMSHIPSAADTPQGLRLVGGV